MSTLITLALIIVALLVAVYYYRRCAHQIDARIGLRRLWSDHVVYTRLYIIARLADDQPAADQYAQRLMKNQDDIGAALGLYFGKTAGDRVAKLLRDHIGGAVTIINDVKAKKNTAADVAKWRANGDDIATALAGLNPKWPLDYNKKMLSMHLDRTLDEVTLLSKHDPKDIANFDAITDDMLGFADYLAKGL